MDYSEEKLQRLSLSDLIALKGYLTNDCINHWKALLSVEDKLSADFKDYTERVEFCSQLRNVVERVITLRLHEIAP